MSFYYRIWKLNSQKKLKLYIRTCLHCQNWLTKIIRMVVHGSAASFVEYPNQSGRMVGIVFGAVLCKIVYVRYYVSVPCSCVCLYIFIYLLPYFMKLLIKLEESQTINICRLIYWSHGKAKGNWRGTKLIEPYYRGSLIYTDFIYKFFNYVVETWRPFFEFHLFFRIVWFERERKALHHLNLNPLAQACGKPKSCH